MPARTSRLTAALLAIALGAIAAPAPASTGVGGPRLGLFFPAPEATGLEALNAVGPTAGVLRIGMGWRLVQPTCKRIHDDVYDWAKADSAMDAATALGVPIILTLTRGPPCSSVTTGSGSTRLHLEPKPRYVDDFAAFVRELVARYGPDGLDEVEVWDEPNLRGQWSDPDGRDYARFFVQVADAVAAAPSSADVALVTGGLAAHDREKFLRTMYRVRGFKADADVIGVHTYAPTPSAAIRGIRADRKAMIAHHDDAPIDVTEHGWSTCPDPAGDTSEAGKCVRPRAQASKLKAYVDALRAPRNSGLGVHDFIWYTPQDLATPRSVAHCRNSPKNFYGFFKHDGTSKPSWNRWQSLTDTTTGPDHLSRNGQLRGC